MKHPFLLQLKLRFNLASSSTVNCIARREIEGSFPMDLKNLLRKGLRIVVSGLNTRKKEIYFHKI